MGLFFGFFITFLLLKGLLIIIIIFVKLKFIPTVRIVKSVSKGSLKANSFKKYFRIMQFIHLLFILYAYYTLKIIIGK